MGRKSALTPEQWAIVEHRHILGGESLNALAKEFGVNESSLRRKMAGKAREAGPVRDQLHDIAARKVQADKASRDVDSEIASLPVVRQMIVSDIVSDLVAISNHMASAGKYKAAAVHRLSALASASLEKVDGDDPVGTAEHLKNFALFDKLSNDAAHIPLTMMKVGQEQIEQATQQDNARRHSSEESKRALSDDAMEASKEYQRIMGGV